MKIKNDYVKYAIDILHGLELPGTKSRMRTRLKNILLDYQKNVLEAEFHELINMYANRDSEGNIIYASKNDISVKEEFYKNYEEFLEEYFIIDKSEFNKKMFLVVAEELLSDKYSFKEILADVYDALCEELESIVEYYNKEN